MRLGFSQHNAVHVPTCEGNFVFLFEILPALHVLITARCEARAQAKFYGNRWGIFHRRRQAYKSVLTPSVAPQGPSKALPLLFVHHPGHPHQRLLATVALARPSLQDRLARCQGGERITQWSP